MDTKIGKIKSISGLFEDKKEDLRTPGPGGDWIMSSVKCKLCGERVAGMDELGACFIPNGGKNTGLLGGAMEEHIKFHKTIMDLNL